MQLSISIRHGHLSEASQAKLKSKAEKLSRYFDRLTAIELIVDLKDPQKPRVDIKASAEHKHDFVAHDQSESLHAAVDSVIEKLQQQIRKYKERVQERHRDKDAKRRGVIAESATGEGDNAEFDEDFSS